MSTYVFKAMDLTGAKATGEVEAESRSSTPEELKRLMGGGMGGMSMAA